MRISEFCAGTKLIIEGMLLKWITWSLFGLIVALIVLGYWLWTPDKPLAELEAKYAAAPSEFITVAGIRLHVRDTGTKSAPALILLHGFGSSLHSWEAWAKTLEKDYRVIRFDLPGSGLTGADPTGNYSDDRSLEILNALMDKLGVARAAVMGNSIGGRIAWKFAAQYPARVSKLVLISPDGFESPGFEYGKKPDVPAVLKLMRYALPKAAMRMNLEPAYANPKTLTDALVTRYHDMMLVPGVRTGMLDRMGQTVLQNPMPLLQKIQAPTLLLWGKKDAMIPFTNAQDYVKALPHNTLAPLAPLANIGHVPQEEAPEKSLVPVLEFLKR